MPSATSAGIQRAGGLSLSSHRPTSTSSPWRKVWPSARNAAAAHSQATMSSAPRMRMPAPRPKACASITAQMAATQAAARTPLAAYRRSRNRRNPLLTAVTLEDFLAVGAGGFLPLGGHLVADLG